MDRVKQNLTEKWRLKQNKDRHHLVMGNTLTPVDMPYSNKQAILWNKRFGDVQAASDPRGIGMAKIE
jgi:gamma-glutamyltranspeptidase